jgi:hypothetical protein
MQPSRTMPDHEVNDDNSSKGNGSSQEAYSAVGTHDALV